VIQMLEAHKGKGPVSKRDKTRFEDFRKKRVVYYKSKLKQTWRSGTKFLTKFQHCALITICA